MPRAGQWSNGTNIGAGQRARVLRIALTGGALAFLLNRAVGVAAAIWPAAWRGLFGHDLRMLRGGHGASAHGRSCLGFFGLGLSLYFASQGAGRPFCLLLAGILRMLIAVGGGWLALRATGAALVICGGTLSTAVASGAWFRRWL